MNWKQCHIGDFVSSGQIHIQTGPFGTQLKAADYTTEGTPVINVRNIGYGHLRPDKLEYVPDSVLERLNKHILHRNDIVFGRKGAVDRHLLVSDEQTGWMQGSDCIRLRVLSGPIDPIFLSFVLRLENHKQWMLTQCSNKATMASLNQDVISRIPISFPDKPTQESIISILNTYDDLIENNRRRIDLLEQAARLLYREWFVHLRFPGHEHVRIVDGVPEGWEKKSLSELADFINGYAFKPAQLGEIGLPIVKIPELKQGVSDKTPRNTGDLIPEKYNLCDGDLLFSWSGTLAVNVWASGPAILNQHLFNVVPKGAVSRAFLMCALRETLRMFDNQTVGATMKHIRRSALDNVFVLLPEHAFLSTADEILINMYKQLIALHRQNQNLAQARDLLLPKLMNGDIAI